jgi:serine phosphatase RsbU (regulator of sigma subunit)
LNQARPRRIRLGARRGTVVALLCTLAVSVLYLLGAFETADLKSLDWRFRIRGPRPASDALVVVEIDDSTIEAYGNWPLPRDQYALLVEAITQSGARAVAMDLLFLGADRYDSRFDDLLAYVTASHDNVVHAMTFSPEEMRFGGGPSEAPARLDILERQGLRDLDVPAFDAASVTLPFEGLAVAGALGHVLVVIDRDGVIRRVPTFVRYVGALYPCLALRAAATGRSAGTGVKFDAVPGGIRMTPGDGGPVTIPIDSDGTTSIDYAGDRSAFSHIVSMVDVLQWYALGDSARLKEVFQDRVALVGATAVRQVAADFGATPFSQATPLVLVHANALNALLTGRLITRPSPIAYVAVLGGLSILVGWILTFVSVPTALGTIAAWLAGFAGLDYALFLRGTDLPPTAGLVLPPLIYAAIQSYQFVFLERKTRERQRELQVARDIQQRLLPSAPPETPELEVFGINIPAQEVGGDYYDWIVLGDDGLAVAVGDVCGKGIPAALLMAHLEASFHAEAKPGVAPATIVEAMNRSLQRSVEPGRFATFVLAVVSRKGTDLVVCNAGHNPGLHVHRGGVDKLESVGLALGILEDMPYRDDRRQFASGDVLVLYSDGVTECQWRNDMYGDERLAAVVTSACAAGGSAEQIGRAILDDVNSFCQGHTESDDLTLVVVRRPT